MKPFFSHTRKDIFTQRANRLRMCELRLDDHDIVFQHFHRRSRAWEYAAIIWLMVTAVLAFAEMWGGL